MITSKIRSVAVAVGLALIGAATSQAQAYEYCHQVWDAQHGDHQVCSPEWEANHPHCRHAYNSAQGDYSECRE